MPKRSAEEQIEFYSSKLKRLQDQQYKRRRRILVLSDSSDCDTNSDHGENINEDTHVDNDNSHIDNEVEISVEPQNPVVEASTEDSVPAIDAELLTALGDTADDVRMYGEKIHPDLAQRWLPILRKGIPKESKDKLLKEYSIPENCKLLRAPTLNAEISAAVTDVARGRDKKIETSQQQLGVGISTLNKAMTLLLTSDDKQNKVKAIKILSDVCRILSDLHYTESQARIKLVTPGLDKAFTNVMQDLERDETLFGIKLSDKIKASKAIEKQGLQIKKGATMQRSATASTSSSQNPTPTRSRYQGNWTGPTRFQPSNRGGRGGPQRSAATTRRAAPPPATQPRATLPSRTRAPARQ